jgi:hypothetical protein
MGKKLFSIIFILSLTFSLSGCYKYDLDISINEQDLINGTLIDALLIDEGLETTDEPNSQIISIKGVTVEPYNQNNYKGHLYKFVNVPLVNFNKVLELPKYNLLELNGLGILLQNLYSEDQELNAAKKATDDAEKAQIEKNRVAEEAAAAKEKGGGKQNLTSQKQKNLVKEQKNFSIQRVKDKLIVSGEINMTTKDQLLSEAFKDAQVKISIQFPKKPSKSSGQIVNKQIVWQGVPSKNIKATAQATTKLAPFKNCKDLNAVFDFGVAKNNTKNKKIDKGIRPFVNDVYYETNKFLDKDKDSIVCEKN